MVRTDEEVDMLFTVLGRPDLLLDPRFLTAEQRVENGDKLGKEMRDVLITQPSDYWMQALTEVGVPVALVGRIDELPNDPQVVANNMAIQPTKEVGMPAVIKHPVNVEGCRCVRRVLRRSLVSTAKRYWRAGYSADDIAQMKEQGTI